MPEGLEQFAQAVVDSGLLMAEELDQFRKDLPADVKLETGEDLGRELVRHQVLTAFQARAIYRDSGDSLVLGSYAIQEMIGAGGMGRVYRAEHRRLRRTVAIKALPPDAMSSPEAVRRFQREVEAAAKLHHPNIVTALDADTQGGVHYLVMEFVDGRDLSPRKGDPPIPVSAVASYIQQAALGLQYAHNRGVVHRDIKPANLLLARNGTVKILDMGMARFGGLSSEMDQSSSSAGLTQTGQIMGTIDYMAPEQAEDARSADARSDIYSLGCTMYCLLTTRPPYEGKTAMQTLLAHREKPIPSICKKRSDAPPGLEWVFRCMVAKKPEDRYRSMHEVVASLLEFCPQTRPSADAKRPEVVYDDDFEFRLADDDGEPLPGEDAGSKTTSFNVASPPTTMNLPQLEVACGCGQRFAAPHTLAGTTVDCPNCQNPLKIPASSYIEQSIEVTCKCGRRFAARPELAGQSLPCPGCGDPLKVPLPKNISVKCDCGQRFAAPVRFAGRAFRCTKCGKSMVLPSE